MNTISFCITCYDQDLYLLPKLLDKIHSFTEYPDEIIILVSGVKTIDIDPKLLNFNKPTILHIISDRIIQAKARNIASSIANSEYIMFFDVDDIPHNRKIEITKKIIDSTNPDFFLHNYSSSGTNNIGISYENISNIKIDNNLEFYPINEIDIFSTNVICKNYPIHHAHITVKKTILDKIKFNESDFFYRREDGKFCQDLVKNKYVGIYSPLQLIIYT